MAMALNLSGFTNCSPIVSSVIIIGVILFTIGVLFVGATVGIMFCLKHNKGAEQYVIFCDIFKHPVYPFVVSCPDPHKKKWSKRSATYGNLG